MSAVIKDIKPTQSKKWRSTCPGFEIRNSKGRNGVWRIPENGDPYLVCGPIQVVGLARESDGTGWAVVVEFQNQDGDVVRWLMPLSLLTDTNEILRRLLDQGLFIVQSPKTKTDIATYLSSKGKARFEIVNRGGWNADSFVLPDSVIGEDSLIQRKAPKPLRKAGTVESWKDGIGKFCIGNSRLTFGVSAGFASPLLDICNIEGGGIHYVGESSTGKTTIIKCASTVFGLPVNSWRVTDNALEGMLCNHNSIGIALDDIGQVNPFSVGEIAYMIANGSGKSRATRDGGVRDAVQFLLLAFSTGEVSIAQCMKKAGLKPMAGQELRMLNISVDAGVGMGAFEELHGIESPKQFADELNNLTMGHTGHVGYAFIESLIKIKHEIPELFETFKNDFRLKVGLGKQSDSQVLRAADRFALIGFSGELATEFGLTGWDISESMNAAIKCFESWRLTWAPAGSRESYQAIEQVRSFLQIHANRFDSSPVDNRVIPNRAGYRDDDAYLIFPATFRDEVCEGLTVLTVVKSLDDSGFLIRDADGKPQARRRKDGERSRFYAISQSILGSDDDA